MNIRTFLLGLIIANSYAYGADMRQAAEELIKQGYKYVDIYLSDKDDPNEPDIYWLHVEKVEIHSPKTLDKRNDELYIFANKYALDSYDGMDVGPVKQ